MYNNSGGNNHFVHSCVFLHDLFSLKIIVFRNAHINSSLAGFSSWRYHYIIYSWAIPVNNCSGDRVGQRNDKYVFFLLTNSQMIPCYAMHVMSRRESVMSRRESSHVSKWPTLCRRSWRLLFLNQTNHVTIHRTTKNIFPYWIIL